MQMETKPTAQTVAQAVAQTQDTTSPPEPRRFSRRRLLTQAVALSAAAVGLSLLAACGANDAGEEPSGVASADKPDAVCGDTAELSQQDITRHQAVHYVDVSPQRDKTCSLCRFFKPPQGNDDGCGACEILAGQVASGGYCNAFVPRA